MNNTPLVTFLFILYITYMCLVRDVIEPFQHLIVVVCMLSIMFFLTYFDNLVKRHISQIDNVVFHPTVKNVIDKTIQFVIYDYNRSKLKKLVHHVKGISNNF